MRLDKIAKKTIAICIVSLLVLSCNFSSKVSAKIVYDKDDGVAYDEFENADDVSLYNCTSADGGIKLNSQPYTITYDYMLKPNNIQAWKIEGALINPGNENFLQLISRFVNPDNIGGDEFSSDEYSKLSARDNKNVLTYSQYKSQLNYTCYPITLFKFQVDQDVSHIDSYEVNWYSGAYDPNADSKEISMYIWSYGDLLPRWEPANSIPYNQDSISYPNNGSIGSNPQHFISSDGLIYVMIVGTPYPPESGRTNSRVYTDFIQLKVTLTDAYKSDGYITSSPIEPDSSKFGGWESVFWEGSRSTNKLYIKLQVLDENKNLIGSLDGNSDGFYSSPIDLSSLGTSPSKIILKATFHTDDISYSPRLDSWGVLWRTKTNGFQDSFTHDFRVDKSYGVKIEGGDVKVSNFYSDWPIFGKDPTNTRSYVGSGTTGESNKTYWYSEVTTDMGGWFRSPVVSNGHVYIAANDNRIYAFNLTSDSAYVDLKQQFWFDRSYAYYNVESSLAVAGDLLIVATSELGSTSNKIYALNISNLSQVMWSYPTGLFPNTACFSSAPTIANGRVYVTVWTGQFQNSPLLGYMYSKLNLIISKISKSENVLGLNNKLIALDLLTGGKVLDVNLPFGSLSTPAVYGGLIFVGCDNMGGPSLFAIDENTGEEVWNASIGTIGRASPIVTEGSDGKVLIVMSREQNISSPTTGTDKVFAFKAETGEMLWNKTIGNETTISRDVLLKMFNFGNLVGTSQPAATPAASDGTVFVMSSNGTLYAFDVDTGEEKWTFDATQGNSGLISSFYSASPAVVGNTVYVAAENGNVYALDASNGDIVVDYPIEFTEYSNKPVLRIFDSPVVADGLVLVSAIEPLPLQNENLGHLICLGDYINNSIGKIYSVPIHVQKGDWWTQFYADYTNTTDNTVNFSILDGNGNVLESDLNGRTDGDISRVANSSIIQLCANLTITNRTQNPPILKSWSVNWTTESTPPVFNTSTFYPDPSGWIHNNTPVFTIKAYDSFPGLDVSSARYRVTYTTNDTSDWFAADCSGVNGTRNNETITADLSKADINQSASLKTIEISIKDLSGNPATFKPSGDFKLDTEKPTSSTNGTFSDSYNTTVDIKADASDQGDLANASGVKTVALYYRLRGEENWTNFGSDESPFEWNFETDISGIYEICTIATDKAGNVEDFPDETANLNSFLFDMNKPYKPEFNDSSYKKLPEFSIEFKDDYELKTVEYKLLEFQADWTKINENDINNQSYLGTWTLNEDDWNNMIDGQTYQMYFRLTDTCGNQYVTSPDETFNITKNTIPPSYDINLDLSDFKDGFKDTYTITASIPENKNITSVILEYRYSSDNNGWNDWTQYGEELTEGPYNWTFDATEGTGYYEFKLVVSDNAGNTVESQVESVNITQFPTALLILVIMLVIILAIVTIIIIKKMKNKK